ncbi:hypothetical protein [Paucibacter sp. KCTC 42545]|uniref:hypothetical protein n=1 Tax=Paucibacter sp. KCTC 42545 TaxID=1768242 RepID=UPI0012E3F9B3|nr:hypothetical protein [Paucibacter sp. KCTC 42545]
MKTLEDFEISAVCGGDLWCFENSDGSVSDEEAAHYGAIAVANGSASSPAGCLGAVTAAGVAGARTGAQAAIYLGQAQLALPAAAVAGTAAAGFTLYNAPSCSGGYRMMARQLP